MTGFLLLTKVRINAYLILEIVPIIRPGMDRFALNAFLLESLIQIIRNVNVQQTHNILKKLAHVQQQLSQQQTRQHGQQSILQITMKKIMEQIRQV